MKYFVLCFCAFFVVNANDEDDLPRNPLWDAYKDDDGKYVIPYVINGTYAYKKTYFLLRPVKLIEIDKNSTSHAPVTAKRTRVFTCSAVVGKLEGKNTVRLESSKIESCLTPKMTMSTLMNVIGLPYEHMRAERDDHIKIHWENIEKGCRYLFARTSIKPDP
ncbi:hypothetical protein ANCDUO_16083 [Ancylostoma duodenale]|uniref:Peptidase M12A domain-containing protein n=1 Tax=Ancylostoma duodenale TaxID=51022 RepID=A0A0C2CBS1_9BILA|nr:hypothetical protein ANCDUO_16083 [Ancylostoma duodenale]